VTSFGTQILGAKQHWEICGWASSLAMTMRCYIVDIATELVRPERLTTTMNYLDHRESTDRDVH